MEIMVLRVLILLLLLLFLSDCEFLDFSVFEKFSFQFIWGVFPPFYSSVPACMRRVCVGAILYVGTSVPACMCTHALRDERPGSLNNMFFSHDFLQPILFQSWAETSELLGLISTSELDQSLNTLQIIELVFLLLITVLVVPCTLLQHPISHALLTFPTPCQREFVCGVCIGTAQVGASLVAPLDCLFKQSSWRSPRDIILVFVT